MSGSPTLPQRMYLGSAQTQTYSPKDSQDIAHSPSDRTRYLAEHDRRIEELETERTKSRNQTLKALGSPRWFQNLLYTAADIGFSVGHLPEAPIPHAYGV